MGFSRAELVQWIRKTVASTLQVPIDQITTHDKFRDLGVDSSGATALVAALSRTIGRALPATLVWEHPTIDALARYLVDGVASVTEPARADQSPRNAEEPIAIVGLSCRFPRAPDKEAFWRLLSEGVDAVTEVPRARWDGAALYDRDLRTPGKMNTRWGGFLVDVKGFDAAFFRVAPREARDMDPQQRLMLELSWEALEDAGILPERLRGTRAGVFFGVVWTDYNTLTAKRGLDAMGQHTVTGFHHSIVANRVSYTLGLEGPSVALDTACSSSLVALHLACDSLRKGESTIALVGGVNLNIVADSTLGVSKFGGLSPDGRCFTFDARANGYVRGEGGGVVVLKPLAAALADGDAIYCVVRGSAVNNNGSGNGLTAPSATAQQALLREAYRAAGVKPADVDYVEAHGTGTQLGDTMEALALGHVLGASRAPDDPLPVGSVKTNIGHLEAAAGVASVIKAALCITHGEVPKSLHFETPNPNIDFSALRLRVQTERTAWKRQERAPIIGVSSFGFGGTNAHVVLEGVRPALGEMRGRVHHARIGAARQDARPVLVFSGQGSQWPRMAFSLVASDPIAREVINECEPLVQAALGVSLIRELSAPAERSRMDRIDVSLPCIVAVEIALHEMLRAAGVVPRAIVGHSIGEVSAACAAGVLSRADAMTVICAQAKVIRQIAGKGTMAVIGKSWSEAADVIADLSDRVGRAIEASPDSTVIAGAPDAVAAVLARVEASGGFARPIRVDVAAHSAQLDPYRDQLHALMLSIAPKAGDVPLYSTVTGKHEAGASYDAAYWVRNLAEPVYFARAAKALIDAGCDTFIEVAPHPIVKYSLEACFKSFGANARVAGTLRQGESEYACLREALAFLGAGDRTESEREQLVVVSSRTAQGLREQATRLADYVAGSSLPMRAIGASSIAHRTHFDHRAAIVGSSKRDVEQKLRALAGPDVWVGDAKATPSAPATGSLREVAAAYVYGASLAPALTLPAELPRYAFVREPFWIEVEPSEWRRVEIPGERVYVMEVDLAAAPELADHVIHGRVVIAGAFFVAKTCMLLRKEPMLGAGLADVRFERPLTLERDTSLRLWLRVHAAEGERARFEIVTNDAEQPVATGVITRAASPLALVASQRSVDRVLDADAIYAIARDAAGLELGARFRWLVNVDIAGDEITASLRGGEGRELPPGLVDAIFQVGAVALTATSSDDAATVLVGVESFAERGEWRGEPLTCVVKKRGELLGDVLVRNASGSYELWCRGVRAQRATRASLFRESVAPIYETTWVELGPATVGNVGPAVVVGRPDFGEESLPPQALSAETVADRHIIYMVAAAGFEGLLSAAKLKQPLTVVTEGGSDAAAWGFVRALRLEQPERRLRLIDHDGDEAALLKEIHADCEEDVRLRGAKRLGVRMRRRSLDAAAIPLAGSHVITGGFGALGLHVAEWLVAQGVEEIVLVGRTVHESARLDALRKTKTRIVCVTADVAKRDDVARVCASCKTIASVIHTAGVLDDGLVHDQTTARFERVAAAKVEGARHFAALTDAKLILFSSVAGTFGNIGQTSYAAANAAVDAIAETERARGRDAISIAWGPWADGGMAAGLAEREPLLGMRSLSAADATAALGRAFSANTNLVIFAGEPAAVAEHFRKRAVRLPVLSALVTPVVAKPGPAPQQREHASALRERIEREFKQVLGVGDGVLDVDRPLMELGIDSLMAVELRDRLTGLTGVALPVTFLFDYPSVRVLTKQLFVRAGLEAEETVVAHATATQDKIAIVGLSCRLPGGANDEVAYWRMLEERRDAISEVPKDRWDVDAYYDPDPEKPGKISTRFGGFLRGVDVAGFDAQFFGIAPTEAQTMDPQQRLVLECVWEALEDAGSAPSSLSGSRTGVFLAISTSDYAHRLHKLGDAKIDPYRGTGNTFSAAAGRVSYVFGFQGPAVAMDTACSSALYALHHAVRSLQSGECDTAVVAAVNLLLDPTLSIYFSRGHFMAPDGRCKSFDASANGYVRGEGCGVLVLRRLPDAETRGDRVRAVIRGTAINQDGRSGGLTVPNGPAQEAVIKDALRAAALEAKDVDYVEAHGTGTQLGDPIEVNALANVYGAAHASAPLLIGSVKTNIGHLEAAAGMASLVKVILALEHEVIPAQLHLQRPNAKIAWDKSGVSVVTAPTRWNRGSRVRRAGISAFAFQGSNAHVILEEAPRQSEAPAAAAERALLVLSARSSEALAAQARRYGHFLAETREPFVAIAAATVHQREHLRWRLALVAESAAAARAKLDAFLRGESAADLFSGEAHGQGGEPGARSLSELARGYVDGDVDITRTTPRAAHVRLPTYAFIRARHWYEEAAASAEVYAVEWRAAPPPQSLAPAPRVRWSGEGDADVVCFAPPARDDYAAIIEQTRALLTLWRTSKARLCVVTAGALGHAAITGLARVLALETPRRLRVIEVPARLEDAARKALVEAELRCEDGEDEVRLRDGVREARRLVRRPASAASFVPRGRHVITGGFGALGFELARWLVSQGVRQLVLVGRDVSKRAADVEALRQRGVTIECVAADVADAVMMARVFEQPVAAVYHCAGVLTRAPSESITDVDLENTFHAKVHGALILDQLCITHGVSRLVLYGSGAAVWGGVRQGAYAAANAVLAAMAARRTGVLCVEWGPWANDGMATDAARAELARIGMRALDETAAYVTLGGMLANDADGAWVVADVDWRVFRAVYEARAARGLLRAIEVAADVAPPAPRGPRLQLGERSASMLRFVREVIAQVTGQPTVADRTPLMELGVDSLMAVKIRDLLQAEVGVPVSATIVFDQPTVEALATHLLGLSAGQREAAVTPKRAPIGEDAVAIIGMGCRLPGGADTAAKAWALLDAGVDLVRDVPATRWPILEHYDPTGEDDTKSYVARGGFLADLDAFDASVFGISATEALAMDPQQRLVLESAWHALEDAGIAPDTLSGARAGVFLGISASEYATISDATAFSVTGTSLNAAPARLSYLLGFEGPALAVDTACSSSLSALHLARHSLLSGECDLVVAGGVNAIVSPRSFVMLSKMQALSRDGRSKAFAAGADGYGRGEGCVMFAMKRLSDARRDGDRVLAVIRASAVNQDGRSSGFTAPNGPAQQRVMEAALDEAGLRAADVQYVEAHGTGTKLGDPIEVQAIAQTLGRDRGPQRPVMLGTAKSNFGHLESAAGAVGVMKVVLSLLHERLPRTLHAERLNPLIPWAQLPVAVLGRPMPWRRGGAPRRAGVSSFGISGTNAHLIIEEAPPADRPLVPASSPRHELLLLQAKTAAALDHLRTEYLALLRRESLADVAASSLASRAAGSFMLVAIASDAPAAIEALRNAPVVEATRAQRPRVAFHFPILRDVNAEVVAQLSAAEPRFREAYERCSDHAFGFQYALATLWLAWGVVPDAITSEGSGERVAEAIADELEGSTRAPLGDVVITMGEESTWPSVLRTLAELHRAGAGVKWASVVAARPYRKVSLPLYPFDRKSFWPTRAQTVKPTAQTPLRWTAIDTPLHTHRIYEMPIDVAGAPELRDHVVFDRVVVPGAFYLSKLLDLLATDPSLGGALADVGFDQALTLREGEVATAWLVVQDHHFEIFCRKGDVGAEKVLIASGELVARTGLAGVEALSAIQGDNAKTMRDFYAVAERVQLHLGRAFKWVETMRGEREAFATMREADAHERGDNKPPPPGLIDSCFQVVGMSDETVGDGEAKIFLGVGHVEQHGVWTGEALNCAVQRHSATLGDALLSNASGSFRLLLRDVRVGIAPKSSLFRGDESDDPSRALHRLTWIERPRDAGLPVPAIVDWSVVVIAPSSRSAAESLAHALSARGLVARVDAAENVVASNGVIVLLPSFSGAPPLRVDEALRPLLEAMQRWQGEARVCIVSEGAQTVLDEAPRGLEQAAVWGFVRAARLEQPELHLRMIDVWDVTQASAALVDEVSSGSDEDEVCLRPGRRYVARLTRVPMLSIPPRAENWRLAIRARGAIDNLELRAITRRSKLGANDIELRVTHVGLNFRDVVNVLGLYPGDPGEPGGDCAGEVVRVGSGITHLRPGDMAFGMGTGSLCRFLVADGRVFARLPSGVAPAAAVTQLVTQFTVDRGLREVAKLRPKERVLIHAAAGGVGMVAIQFAKHIGAEIFATASEGKQALVRSLGVEHVYDSRSERFYDEILRDTGGEGVDVVLNSLTGDKLKLSARLLRAGGRFIEIGKVERLTAATFRELNPVATYHTIAVDSMLTDEPEWFRGAFERLSAGLTRGYFAPLPMTTFGVRRAAEAFRYLAQGRNVGKVVLEVEEAQTVAAGTYVISGGLGALGLAVGTWLARRGAKDIVLIGRRTPSEDADAALARMRDAGAAVIVERADVAKREDVARIFADVKRRGSRVVGVIHAAGVLHDGLLREQSWAAFEDVLHAKVRGAWNLAEESDDATRVVSFSSIAGVLGNPGQTSYAAANAFLDAFAQEQRARGRAHTSIAWGPWAEGGMAASLVRKSGGTIMGLRALSTEEGLRLFELAWFSRDATLTMLPGDVDRLAEALARHGAEMPAKLRDLVKRASVTADLPARGTDLSRELEEQPVELRSEYLERKIGDEIRRALGMPGLTIEPERPLMDLGIDSLLAVELRNRVASLIGRRLPSSFVFDHPTLRRMSARVLALLGRPSAPERPQQTKPDLMAEVAALSPQQVSEVTDAALSELLTNLKGSEGK